MVSRLQGDKRNSAYQLKINFSFGSFHFYQCRDVRNRETIKIHTGLTVPGLANPFFSIIASP